VNFTETLINGAWFNVTVWIIDQDVPNAAFKHGDVKWNYYISHWPFQAGSTCTGEGGAFCRGKLILNAGLVGFAGVVKQEDRLFGVTNVTISSTTYGNGLLSSPDQGWYDDAFFGPVLVTHSLQGKPEVNWTFAPFTNSVAYDPTAVERATTGKQDVLSPTGPVMITIYTILGLLVIVILIVAIRYSLKPKRRESVTDVDLNSGAAAKSSSRQASHEELPTSETM
jgi:hypothetical protein